MATRISRRNLGLVAGAAWSGFAWQPAAGAPGAVHGMPSRQRRARPAEVSDVGGFLGRRLSLNAAYLAKFDVDPFVDMLEHKKYRDWFWIGEQPGKWLEAAVYASASCGDAALTAKAQRVLARIVAAQDRDGYLGITDPAVRTRRHPMRGVDAYEMYYTLHGLLTAAEQWESARPGRLRCGSVIFWSPR